MGEVGQADVTAQMMNECAVEVKLTAMAGVQEMRCFAHRQLLDDYDIKAEPDFSGDRIEMAPVSRKSSRCSQRDAPWQRARTAEEISLDTVAAKSGEEVEFMLGFHPFHNDK